MDGARAVLLQTEAATANEASRADNGCSTKMERLGSHSAEWPRSLAQWELVQIGMAERADPGSHPWPETELKWLLDTPWAGDEPMRRLQAPAMDHEASLPRSRVHQETS